MKKGFMFAILLVIFSLMFSVAGCSKKKENPAAMAAAERETLIEKAAENEKAAAEVHTKIIQIAAENKVQITEPSVAVQTPKIETKTETAQNNAKNKEEKKSDFDWVPLIGISIILVPVICVLAYVWYRQRNRRQPGGGESNSGPNLGTNAPDSNQNPNPGGGNSVNLLLLAITGVLAYLMLMSWGSNFVFADTTVDTKQNNAISSIINDIKTLAVIQRVQGEKIKNPTLEPTATTTNSGQKQNIIVGVSKKYVNGSVARLRKEFGKTDGELTSRISAQELALFDVAGMDTAAFCNLDPVKDSAKRREILAGAYQKAIEKMTLKMLTNPKDYPAIQDVFAKRIGESIPSSKEQDLSQYIKTTEADAKYAQKPAEGQAYATIGDLEKMKDELQKLIPDFNSPENIKKLIDAGFLTKDEADKSYACLNQTANIATAVTAQTFEKVGLADVSRDKEGKVTGVEYHKAATAEDVKKTELAILGSNPKDKDAFFGLLVKKYESDQKTLDTILDQRQQEKGRNWLKDLEKKGLKLKK